GGLHLLGRAFARRCLLGNSGWRERDDERGEGGEFQSPRRDKMHGGLPVWLRRRCTVDEGRQAMGLSRSCPCGKLKLAGCPSDTQNRELLPGAIANARAGELWTRGAY